MAQHQFTTEEPALDWLKAEATRLRRAIEQSDRHSLRAGSLSEFPHKCCRHGTYLSALRLSDLGLTGFVEAIGYRPRRGEKHFWLECRSIIIDITADQFGKSYPPVIVTRFSRWHDAWNPVRELITEESLTKWREAETPLDGIYNLYREILADLRGDAPPQRNKVQPSPSA